MRAKFLVGTALALVLAVVGVNLHGQGGGKTVRQAWEYKALVGVFPISGAATLHEDGNPIRGTPLSRARELGDEGWELVSVAGTVLRDTTQFLYWFKRPK